MRLSFLRTTLAAALVITTATAASSASRASRTRRRTSKPAVTSEDLRQLREALAAQQQQIQALRQELERRDDTATQAAEAARQAQSSAQEAVGKAASVESTVTQGATSLAQLQADLTDLKQNQANIALSAQDDQKKLAAVEGVLGRFRINGDVRVRSESFFQSYSGCVACNDRNRARIRLRVGLEGKLNDDFTAGIYLASGAVINGAPTFYDPVSTNETLTSFFQRKTVGFDRGYITYQPQAHKWLQLTGGKWAYSWSRTSMTFDPDLNPEGFNQKFSFDLPNRVVKNFSFQGMQLLFNEVGVGPDSNALGGNFSTRLQLGKNITITPSYTLLNFNGADAIAQAAFPVTLPQPITPAPGTVLPAPTVQPLRFLNANAFTNASRIVGTGTHQSRAFVSGFLYSDFILDTNIVTPFQKYPFHLVAEYEQNLRARRNTGAPSKQDKGYWFEATMGQQKERNDLLFGYTFARIEQDAVISQFNESDLRAATNVVQHRIQASWLVQKNITAAFALWIGRTLNSKLQNASRAPGLAAGIQDPFLKRMQIDLIYKF